MISLPTSVLDLLDEGRINIRGLIRFDFGTGTYGFIKAQDEFDHDGVTYQPGGILEVSDLGSGTGSVARQFSITLAASPDDELTPAVLQTIEQEDYRDRPVTISDAFFHPGTNALLHVQLLRRGYVDTIDHEDDENGYRLLINCETRALDYSRTNGRKRSNADQQRRAPGDRWFEHASTRGREEVFWGRKRGK